MTILGFGSGAVEEAVALYQELPVLEDGVAEELALLLLEDLGELSPETVRRLRELLPEGDA